ncbi:hypothetical protein G5I_10192, partial [Acromyrmex echinatior]
LVYLLEPTSSAKPKLPSVRKVEFMESRAFGAANLMCPVQGYPVPISSKAPAFAGDAKLSLLVRKANMDVSLPCNAQGHPPPVSRKAAKFDFVKELF